MNEMDTSGLGLTSDVFDYYKTRHANKVSDYEEEVSLSKNSLRFK